MDSGPDLASVGVVVVNFACLPELRACIAQPAVRAVGQLVIVDNASDPEEVQALCEAPGRDAVLRSDNGGFAVGVNAGLAVLDERVRVVWLLNPDVTVTPAVRDALLARLGEGWDGVAPNVVEPGGRGQVGAGGGPLTVRSFATYFWFLSHLLPSRAGLFFTRRQGRQTRQADWIGMGCAVLTRDAFGRFGPLPEDELVYGEDIAWGVGATAGGARLLVDGGLQVVHAHGSSGASHRFVGSIERLARRRLGPVRGRAAVLVMRSGLLARRAVGRKVAGAARAAG